MYVLISYDIVNNRIRNKVMKFLLNYGHRVQKSVFECHLEEEQFQVVKNGLKDLIRAKEDSVRFYRICLACMKRVEISGWGAVTEDEEFTII